MAESNVSKEDFVERTGFSERQYYRWFTDGQDASSPSAQQMSKICAIMDWSPTYLFFGVGPSQLSAFNLDLEQQLRVMGRVDDFYKEPANITQRQAVLIIESNHELLKQITEFIESGIAERNNKLLERLLKYIENLE